MAQAVLLGAAELRHRLAKRRQVEDGVVAEAVGARGRRGDDALADALFLQPAAVWQRDDEDDAIARRAPLRRHALQRVEEYLDALRVVAAVPAALVAQRSWLAAPRGRPGAGGVGPRGGGPRRG